MASGDTTSFIEKINHQTQLRPFSLHHTVVLPNIACALYLHCHSEMEFFYLENMHKKKMEMRIIVFI